MRVKLFQSFSKDVKKLEDDINAWIDDEDPVIDEIRLACSISPGEHSYTNQVLHEVIILYSTFNRDEIN